MQPLAARALRWCRRIVVMLAIVAVASPAVRGRDSFPLSTYPVYASVRPRTTSLDTAIGYRADGSSRPLSMDVIAATDDPLIAQHRVAGAVADGRAGDLCARIADRAPAGVVAVAIVRQRHDVVLSARGAPSLLETTTHARCTVQP